MNGNSDNRRHDHRSDEDFMPDSLESAEVSPREKPSQEDGVWTPFDLPLDSFKRSKTSRREQMPVEPQATEQVARKRVEEMPAPVPEETMRPVPEGSRAPQIRPADEDREWDQPTIGSKQEWEADEDAKFSEELSDEEMFGSSNWGAYPDPVEPEYNDNLDDIADFVGTGSEDDSEDEEFTAPEEVEAVEELVELAEGPIEPVQDEGPIVQGDGVGPQDGVEGDEAEGYSFPTAPLPEEVQAAIELVKDGATPEEVAENLQKELEHEPSFRPAEVAGVSSESGLAEDLSEAIDSEHVEEMATEAQEEFSTDDININIKEAFEPESTGEVEAWEAQPSENPEFDEAEEDEAEDVPENLRKPSDAERLRKRLEKYPESRGDRKQAFKLNLNRASHRYGIVAVAVVGVLLIFGVFALANRVQRERANAQAAVEKHIVTMKVSEGNIPNEQRVQHSDGQRIVNASIPFFGDPQIDQMTQAWAKEKIDEFEIQTSVLPANIPDKRPILALSHRSYLVEGELASIQLVAETYMNTKDMENGTLQRVESEDILYDISYRTFLDPTDIFREDAPSRLASLGTEKLQAGDYRVLGVLAAPAYERQAEIDKAQDQEPGVTPQAEEGDAPQAMFGVKTLLAEEAPAEDAVEEAVVDEAALEENSEAPAEDGEAEDETETPSSEIPREIATEEQREPDTTFANVVLPETTILYKFVRFQPDGLELELDPALVPDNSRTIAVHYSYDEILDVLRFDTRPEGGYLLNLRIDPLGDTQRQFASRLLETLYGTGLEERALPSTTETTTEEVLEESIDESPDASPIEGSDAEGENTEEGALFAPKILSAEDAAPVESSDEASVDVEVPKEEVEAEANKDEVTEAAETDTDTEVAQNEETPQSSPRRAAIEPTISRGLNQAGIFPQGGLELKDHFVRAKARYDHEIRYVALTYNNAPSTETTNTLLNLLDSYRGHGTFFVSGSVAAQDFAGPLMQSIVEQGSEIGNNAYNFFSFTVLTDAQIQAEINETAAVIEQKSGVRPTFTRPPYGDYDERTLAAGGVPMVNWSFTSGDDWGAETDVIYDTLLEYIEPGAIVLSMDGNEDTVQALQRALPELYGRGYRFVTLSDLFAIYTQDGAQDSVLYSSVWSN